MSETRRRLADRLKTNRVFDLENRAGDLVGFLSTCKRSLQVHSVTARNRLS